ncbi:hypothetical protein [Hymenobacter sp. APR13]|uniref:hypothetical protein n=1 Tax=Hymenobacter sp. APR13 TaxID=1356852 RepID=UPI0012E0B1D0|nr:hypothetical protein [Hymenobacter sp. APR13]
MKSGGNYASSLRKLVTSLRKAVPAFEWDEIDGLAGYCHGISSKLKLWEYELKDFSFPSQTLKIAELDKVHPVTVKNYKVVLSIEASGTFIDAGTVEDPIKDLEVNIVVTDLPGEEPESIYCAWHLDSHPPKNSKGPTASKFAHPRYHWQYGGKKVWENINPDFYGSHLLLESPRLPHPPLDIILAIDFVFANYYAKQWQTLREDDEYQRVIEEAQERFWKPYFLKIQDNWMNRSAAAPLDLMPFFFPKILD